MPILDSGGLTMKKQHRLSHKDAVKFGKRGGNPLLLWARKHPEAAKRIVKGR